MAACLLAISGCGSSDNGVASKSGKEILAATKAAAAGASSVRVASKSFQGRASFTNNVELSREGGRAQVSVLGLTFEVVQIGETVYLKGGSGVLEQLGITAHVPQGTWLKGSASGKLAEMASFTDLRGTLDRMLSTSSPVAKGAATTVNGQKAIGLKEATKLYKGVLYVATTGKPYPIQMVKRGGKETGLTTFTAWNRPISLSAPSPSIDVNSLKG